MKISLKSLWLLLFVFLIVLASCQSKQNKQVENLTQILPQLEKELNDLAQVWYPRTIDSIHGGFWSDFNYRWEKKGKQHKMLVSQARHIWTSAVLAKFYEDAHYQKIAAHGFDFLKNHMWDTINGGFYTLLGTDGGSLKLLSTGKSTYGNAFAIYGLATYYAVSKDKSALDLAKKTFYWLEEHAHDKTYKGYFDVLNQDGSLLLEISENNNNYANFIRKDWKDQNSSIHLLECLTALYQVWPDKLVKERLEELLLLIRDTITTKKGYLTLHLQQDWTPVSLKDSSETYRKQNFGLDHVSFGHDVETAFLMLEASHVLGLKNDSVTLAKAKKMVDHALTHGWDTEKGGFYDGGYYYEPDVCTIENQAKIWWTEAEGLNSLLLMSKLFPKEKRYSELFKKQWDYIKTYMIDQQYKGWHGEGLDSNPEAKYDAKAQIWKVNYHNIRSLINVIEMLRGDFVLTKNLH